MLMEVSATDTNRSVHVETGSALPWEDADTGGTVDGETEVLSGGRERQVAGGQAGGRVEATTGGEGPSYTSWSSTNSNNSNNIYKRNKNKK